MVRFTLKRSLREESCCSLLVVNGGGGIAAALLAIHGANDPVRLFQGSADLFRVLTVVDFDLFLTLAKETSIKCRRLGGRKMSVDGPIFFFLESLDFTFALDDKAKRDSLNATSGKAATNFIPEERRNLIADETVEYAARLLRID